MTYILIYFWGLQNTHSLSLEFILDPRFPPLVIFIVTFLCKLSFVLEVASISSSTCLTTPQISAAPGCGTSSTRPVLYGTPSSFPLKRLSGCFSLRLPPRFPSPFHYPSRRVYKSSAPHVPPSMPRHSWCTITTTHQTNEHKSKQNLVSCLDLLSDGSPPETFVQNYILKLLLLEKLHNFLTEVGSR